MDSTLWKIVLDLRPTMRSSTRLLPELPSIRRTQARFCASLDLPVALAASLECPCGGLANTILTHTLLPMPVEHNPITVWVSEQIFDLRGRK